MSGSATGASFVDGEAADLGRILDSSRSVHTAARSPENAMTRNVSGLVNAVNAVNARRPR